LIYRITGVREEREMRWDRIRHSHAAIQRGIDVAAVNLIERTQHWLLFNPQKLSNVAPDLAWKYRSFFSRPIRTGKRTHPKQP